MDLSVQAEQLAVRILDGAVPEREEILRIAAADVQVLAGLADGIRRHFCGNSADICCIVNAKSGRCSENCKFCAQSSFYRTEAEEYPLVSTQTVLEHAERAEQAGIMRYSLVCSGRKPAKADMPKLVEFLGRLKQERRIGRCASLGLLEEEEYLRLKEKGLERVHNNLESSRAYFPNVCTTHTFDDKIRSIRLAQKCGLEVCSGGIWGLGESLEDRLDMAFVLRELGILSVPINILFPIAGTPYERNAPLGYDEIIRSLALYRFILPAAFLRLAGGRKLLPDSGRRCFESGANALITGDMLTTSGVGVEEDKKMLKALGFSAE